MERAIAPTLGAAGGALGLMTAFAVFGRLMDARTRNCCGGSNHGSSDVRPLTLEAAGSPVTPYADQPRQ